MCWRWTKGRTFGEHTWKSEWTVKWRLKELLAGVFGSTVIHWLAVGGLVNSKDPFSVLYLARITRDFIPAKPSTMGAEAHFLCIKLSYYVFLLIQMYVLHCLFYFICKDIIWIFNTIIPVHDFFLVQNLFWKIRWDTISGAVTFSFVQWNAVS